MLLDKLLTKLAIHVEPFAICEVDSGWRLRLPGPPSAMVHFVLQGSGLIRGPKSPARQLGVNTFAIVPANTGHALEAMGSVRRERRIDAPPPEKAIHYITAGSSGSPALVVACGVLFARFGQSLGLFDHLRDIVSVDMSDTQQVAAAFQVMLAEQSKPGLGSDVLTAAMMSQCLVYFFRHLCAEPEPGLPWLSAINDTRLGRTIDLILENPAADYTVDSLADAAGMSRSAFARHFASAVGHTPMALVHAVRMQRAVDFLREGSLPIDRICHLVGYTSRSHFSRAFKRHVGVSPSQFREVDASNPTLAAGRLGSSPLLPANIGAVP